MNKPYLSQDIIESATAKGFIIKVLFMERLQDRQSPMAKHALDSGESQGEFTGKTQSPPPFQLLASDASPPAADPSGKHTAQLKKAANFEMTDGEVYQMVAEAIINQYGKVVDEKELVDYIFSVTEQLDMDEMEYGSQAYVEDAIAIIGNLMAESGAELAATEVKAAGEPTLENAPPENAYKRSSKTRKPKSQSLSEFQGNEQATSNAPRLGSLNNIRNAPPKGKIYFYSLTSTEGVEIHYHTWKSENGYFTVVPSTGSTSRIGVDDEPEYDEIRKEILSRHQ